MIGVLLLLAEALLLGSCQLTGNRRLLHYFQLESYQLPGYFRSLRRSPARTMLPGVITAVCGCVIFLLFRNLFAACAVCCAAAAVQGRMMKNEKAKKAFVVTERVKRLMAVLTACGALLSLILLAIAGPFSLLLCALSPLVLVLAAELAQPVENGINRQFAEDAGKRLEAMPGLIRIGITGSYGKTSTKFLLKDILSVKYRVLATPGSFNTTMGVTRVIREQLTGAFDVFIAEMGARHVGDIRELVELVHPTMGLVTSVGPQHLDTFGTVETVRDTKYELIAGLPENGTAVIAKDGAYCDEMFAKCPLERKYQPGDLMRAENLQAGPWGMRFTLTDVSTGEQASCETKLLGEHSISNLLLCCTAARCLGMTLQEIARGVGRCSPVEHRLQLLSGGSGISIIDDAFNSNPVGASCALRVLKGFPGRRIIVTPGMVELGEREEELNRAFGTQMAESADEVFLVGTRHTKPIADALLAAGFPQEHLHVTASLAESTALLQPMMRAGDVILYENDLPDNYTEK